MMQVKLLTIRGAQFVHCEEIINETLADLDRAGAFHVEPPVLIPWHEGRGQHAREMLNVQISYQMNQEDWNKMQAQETATPVAEAEAFVNENDNSAWPEPPARWPMKVATKVDRMAPLDEQGRPKW